VVIMAGYASNGCVTEPVDVAKCEMAEPSCPAELPVCRPKADDPSSGRCEPCEGGDCLGDTVCDLGSGRCVQCLRATHCGDDKPVCKLADKAQDNECVQCLENDDCASETDPACDLERNVCVECVDDEQCEGTPETPVCDTGAHRCVVCNEDSECDSPDAAQCDSATHECVPCTSDEHCEAHGYLDTCSDAGSCVEDCSSDEDCGLEDPSRPACGKEGLCVECTPSEESACGGNVCDPMKETCTAREQGSKGVCERCIADSECGDEAENPSETHRCIALSGDSEEGRCLEQRASSEPECRRPFVPEIFRESLSGEPERAYCGINESLTTCEAVLAGRSGTPCPTGNEVTECAPQGALCESMSGIKTCTYSCGNALECPQGLACESGRCRL
jgi:hypothetical protein